MIISHKYRFIFIKTFKVAGTSLEIALSKYLDDSDVITPISTNDERIRARLGFRSPQNYRCSLAELSLYRTLTFVKEAAEYLFVRERFWLHNGRLLVPPHYKFWNHMPAKQIVASVPTDVWNDYFKFSIERNPWDYALSLYFWRRKSGLDLSDFSAFLESDWVGALRNFDLYSIDGQIVVDQVINFESLHAGLSDIARRIGLPDSLASDINSIRAKRSATRDYRKYYDKSTRELVARKFADAVTHFGYEF